MFSISNLPADLKDAMASGTRSVDILLTDREAATLLHVGLSTFHRHVAQGLVPRPIKLGGTSRWPLSEILAVVEAAKAKRDGTTA